MKELDKYHKQTRDKKTINSLKTVNDEFKLGFNIKSDLDLLWLEVFQTGVANKKAIESVFESVRNQHFDMWDNLLFNERNFLIKCERVDFSIKHESFIYEETRIYIPFFSRLLNSLYDTETAILELPQYFKLYTDYKDKVGPVKQYGLAPINANMSGARSIVVSEDLSVLYQPDLKIFYRVSMKECVSYPIYIDANVSEPLVKKLANALFNFDEEAFINLALENSLLHPKCIKNISKQREKKQKRDKKNEIK